MENAYLRDTKTVDNLYALIKVARYNMTNPHHPWLNTRTIAFGEHVNMAGAPCITITWVNGYRESGIAGFVNAMDILEQWAATQIGRSVPATEEINFVFAGGAMLCYFGARYICKVAIENL